MKWPCTVAKLQRMYKAFTAEEKEEDEDEDEDEEEEEERKHVVKRRRVE